MSQSNVLYQYTCLKHGKKLERCQFLKAIKYFKTLINKSLIVNQQMK